MTAAEARKLGVNAHGASKYQVATKADPLRYAARIHKGIVYDSALEARTAAALDMEKAAGEVLNIRRQVRFPLVVNGHHICDYKADFVVRTKQRSEVREVKGKMTRDARIILKLFEALYPKMPVVLVRR